MPNTYRILDLQTRQYLRGIHKTRKQAQRRADRKDLEYGAIRYVVMVQDGHVCPPRSVDLNLNAPETR
jgi:hypothetical protein